MFDETKQTQPHKMRLNVKRKVGEIRLRPHEYLFPLFEAVVNGIHAIEEAQLANDKGVIFVDIVRDTIQATINDNESEMPFPPVKEFIVKDNGIGFNDTNYEAFNNAYTEHKLEKGGKGVGRFTVLAGFNQMQVESRYKKGEDIFKRKFCFDVENEVVLLDDILHNEKSNTGTSVRLIDYKPEFYEKSKQPKAAIGERIVDHCLIYFLTGVMPRLILREKDHAIELWDIFENYARIDGERVTKRYENYDFEFLCLKKYSLKTGKQNHKIHYCANSREVDDDNIASFVPNLQSSMHDDRGKFSISVYLTGKYLDNNVSDTRNTFTIPNKLDEKDIHHKISFDDIKTMCREFLEEKFSSYINEVEEKKRQDYTNRIYKRFIEYRHLTKNSQVFKDLPPNLDDSELEIALHKANHKIEVEQRARVDFFLKQSHSNSSEEYTDELSRIMQSESTLAESRLSQYMMHRKAILKIFEKMLKWSGDNKFQLEKEIHNIIFPMGEENDTIPFEKHNLWLLDERLVFQTYIASDKKIKKLKPVLSDSGKEPDLALFNIPHALSSDDREMISIFEFKRPGRKLSVEKGNVDEQVKEYFELLIKSGARDFEGKLLNIDDNTPKYGFIIGDIDKDLVRKMKMDSYIESSSGTLSKYLKDFNMHIEMMSYDHVVKAANQRHRAFFRLLGIDML